MQIVILDAYSVDPGDLGFDRLKEFGTLNIYDRTPPEETAKRIYGADIVLTNKVAIGEKELERARNLRFIGVLATGYNIIDTAACARRGITVCNVPAYSTDAVAQHTFALLLEICNAVAHHDLQVHRGRWSACPDFCFWDMPLTELAGKTMGVFGTGRIGCRVARIAEAFGMRVLGTSRHEAPGFAGQYVPFEQMLAESDVLSLHCPATPETERLINEDTLARMKDGAILINCARGTLIDAEAVARALDSGKLRAYGTDVAEREPMPRTDPLLTAKNCVITPHHAWAPFEARQRLMRVTEENIRAFLSGEPVNRVK